jgi:thymidylate synthase
MSIHPEYQYLNLIKDILEKGSLEETRNGKTKSIFGYSMRFSLKDGELPLLTTKKVAWKTCFRELQWFIRGSTNNKELQDKNVHIWDGNSTREFLDSRGLHKNEVNDLGPIYGHQWRHFNAEYVDCHTDYSGKGIDQLNNVINDLKNPSTRSSRRHIITAWNPCQINEMALPPCHILMQFNVRDNKYLSCALMQRSIDTCIGAPINIASYSFLTHIIAKHCDLIADEFIYFLGNAHIYEEHFEPIQEQLKREPFQFPKINILQKHDNIEDYTIDDIEWVEKYVSFEPIKMIMKA